MTKDRTKCRECQFSAIEYTTTVTGGIIAHGVCRQCYEKRAARGRHIGGGFSTRTPDMKENVYETKHGLNR